MGEILEDYFRRGGVKIHRTLIEITPHILGVEKNKTSSEITGFSSMQPF